MKRIYSIALLLSAFLCYFEWGNHSAFLIEIQYELLSSAKESSLLHPFIVFPAIGQLILLISLIKPNKILILTGLILLGLIVLMVLITGIFSGIMPIIVSALPYLFISVAFIRSYKRLS